EHRHGQHDLRPSVHCQRASPAAISAATAAVPPHHGIQRNRATSVAVPRAARLPAIRTPSAPPDDGPTTTSAAATANGATRPAVTTKVARDTGRAAQMSATAASQAEATAAVEPVQPAGPSTACAPAIAPSDGEPHRTIAAA